MHKDTCCWQPTVKEQRLIDRYDGPALHADFARLAQGALHYLANNPIKENDYECRFSFFLLECPPLKPQITGVPGRIDPISEGDTESRNDIAFSMMRAICGEETGREEQEAVHRRLLSKIRDGGAYPDMVWCNPYSACIVGTGEWASTWGTGKLLQSECLRYLAGEGDLTTARRLFRGMRAAASREGGMAWYEAGGAFFREGEIANPYRNSFPLSIGPVCDYYMASGDPEALVFARELAEGFLADRPEAARIGEDGECHAHNHVLLHAVRGMAQLAYLTGDPRYTEWVKTIYDYYRRWAGGAGWLAERRDLPDHSNHSETCLNADMLEIEVWLALCGYTYLWDRAERGMRNYFLPACFTVTPEIEALYRRVNAGRPAGEVERSLEDLRALEGGFLSALTPNDRVFPVREGGDHFGTVELDGERIVLDMMGCCPPEGMRALYFIWRNTVTRQDEQIRVNMAFDADTSLAAVRSSLPSRGRLEVTAKVAGTYAIRVPRWAPRDRVQAYRGTEKVPAVWGGPANDYLLFEGMTPGETAVAAYPLAEVTQEVKVRPAGQDEQTYTYHWVGNTVVGVQPRGRWLPLYEA